MDISKLKRDDVVPFYAKLIISNPADQDIIKMNELILSKWSSSGLNYIKVRAWRSLGIEAS